MEWDETESQREKNKIHVCRYRQGRRNRIGNNVIINTFSFERVKRFKYLGATIAGDNVFTEEVNVDRTIVRLVITCTGQ